MASALHHNARVLESRRRVENGFREMDNLVQNDRKVLQMAHFENKTLNKIERRTKQQMFDTMKRERDDSLIARRKKLADLYNYEIDMWRQEVLAREETLEDRKAKIMERAYALRDARESARLTYVKQRLDDQWRDACDDARTLDSKAATQYMNRERLQQIQDKRTSRQTLSHAEDAFLEEWNRQLAEMEKRDADKTAHRRRMDQDTSSAVRAQMAANERMKEEAFAMRMRSEEDELHRLRREIEEDEAKERKRVAEAVARGKDILRFNSDNRRLADEDKAVDRQQEAILLDYALRKEREVIAAEEEKRNANRQAAKQYRKYLEEQMVKEAEDTAFVDEIRRAEEEKVWKARDDALRARDDARSYLMKMVDDGRQEQIAHKRHVEVAERAHDATFARKFIDEAQEAMRKERDEAEARRRVAVDNNERLNAQIAIRREREAAEKQEAYLADKQMRYMERMHQQRLADQAGTVRMNFPLAKNNWYS